MREYESEIPGGSLYFEQRKTKDGNSAMILTRVSGMPGEIIVPENIEKIPVTIAEKKAFLSKKSIRRIVFPDSVKDIGDWAFAYCDSLKEVELPEAGKGGISFGKDVFKECPALKRLIIRGKDAQIGALLASVVEEAPYLLNTRDAGSDEWLSKWDARMMTILHTRDDEGYSKQILCGEEDYGSTDLGAFCSNARKRKVRIAMLRLLNPTGLSEENEKELKDYLLAHTKKSGYEDGEEAWTVVLNEYGTEREYYELFARLGCLNEDNFDAILKDIKGEHTEMKAYFLQYMEEKKASSGGEDFFAGLEL